MARSLLPILRDFQQFGQLILRDRPHRRAARVSALALCLCMILPGSRAWGQTQRPVAPLGRFGAIRGVVNDSHGIAQAGVPLTVIRQDGLFIRKIVTARNGRFELTRLLPGIYAVEIMLPDFLPFSKAPLSIQAGSPVQLDISLHTLAESVEISMPSSPAQSRDDWKWALRSAAVERPVLRFQEEIDRSQRNNISLPREHPLRGTVVLSAGNEGRTFGADPGLRTIFNMNYDFSSSHALNMAGSAGFERGTPAASFRAAWNRRSDNGSLSSFSATMHQLFLTTAYRSAFAISELPSDLRIQSFNGKYENESTVGDRIGLRYGAAVETVTLNKTLAKWSPFGQLTYTPSDQTRWILNFTGEAPNLSPPSPSGANFAQELLVNPQISSRSDGEHSVALESGKHVEAAWQHRLGSRYRVEAATFFDSLSNVALAVSSADQPLLAGLLRDPFSENRFLDGGKFSSPGARATVAAKLSGASELIVSYSYAGNLLASAGTLATDDATALRDLLRSQRGSSFAVKVRSTVPRSHTEVVTSYKWIPANTVLPGDAYNTGAGRSDPYLNLAVVQPIPSPEFFSGQFRAVADFSNLLAQGYVAVHNLEGASSFFYPSARSFRGGFSFVF
jgi:carboxypeptidase family protein